tara:strand:- start:1671 stop:2195 length:525 start_codon:yes stop_codon:yes gene_type:complete
MFKGWFGEQKTEFNLWLSLDKELYRRFHNVIIPSNNGTTQVDHILVSPFGLFIVETKNRTGWIYGSVRWKMTAKEIINLVRALDYSLFTSPTTSPTASINGMQIIIRKARIIDNVEGDPGKILSIVDDGIIVGSGNNKSVMLTMVECPDKGTLSGIEIGSSLSINLGDKFKIVD